MSKVSVRFHVKVQPELRDYIGCLRDCHQDWFVETEQMIVSATDYRHCKA